VIGTFTTVEEITGVADARDAIDQAAAAARLPIAAVCARCVDVPGRREDPCWRESIVATVRVL
jgi:hypothetical protein